MAARSFAFVLILVVFASVQSQLTILKSIGCPKGAGNSKFTNVGINLHKEKLTLTEGGYLAKNEKLYFGDVEFAYINGPTIVKIPVSVIGVGKLGENSDLVNITYSIIKENCLTEDNCPSPLPAEKYWEYCIHNELTAIPLF